MKTEIVGFTRFQLPIWCYTFEEKKAPHVLVMGGVHGDESEGVVLAQALLGECFKSFSYRLRLSLIPTLNWDGVLLKTRQNASGVDLNRNLPTSDWSPEIATPRYHPGPKPASEPENQALIAWLKSSKPSLIISLHSWKPMLNINGDCEAVANVISKVTGYKVERSIGYPTPGSLGTYGVELGIPTLTYEIEQGLHPHRIIEQHLPALRAAFQFLETPQ